MKNLLAILTLIFMPILLNGCEVIGDIFKAGIWVGLIIVVAIIAVIFFIVRMFKS